MIFIGGVQPRKIKVSDAKRTCPNCGLMTVEEKRIDHYLSLFFIPLVPIKRGEPFWVCSHCNLIQDQAGRPAALSAPQAGGRYCSSCQKDFLDTFDYCPYCGRRLRESRRKG